MDNHMELSTGMSCATADDGGDPICTPSLHKLQESAAKDPATATPSNSLRSIADCYAMQIAIRGGIQQAISDAVEAFEERTSKLAAAHLAEEKVKLAKMVQERQSKALARPSLPIKCKAVPVEELSDSEAGFEADGEDDNATKAGNTNARQPTKGRLRKQSGEKFTMVRYVLDGKNSTQLRATVMPQGTIEAKAGPSGIPLYMTWTYVSRNVTTKEEGRQMFYTDETGAGRAQDFIGNYIGRTREEEACIREVMKQFGRNSVIVKELASQLEICPEDVRQVEKEIFREERPPKTERLSQCLTRMNSIFCRRCRIYACKLHVEAQSSTAGGRKGSNPPDKAEGWSQMELDLIATGLEMYGPRSCEIARLLGGRPCWEVRRRLEQQGNQALGISATDLQASTVVTKGQEAEASAPGKAKLKKHASAKKKKSQPNQVVKKRLMHDRKHAWPQYTPCNCAGPCDEKTCPCAKAGNFCEKFCGCSSECNLRFPGCQCRSGCRNRACPCLAAGRECDPDLCKNCAPTCTGEAKPGRECFNMRVRLRQHARIVMGLSSVAGWGAFLQHAVKKNDFLGEYTGEIISQDEADRRGKVYDRVDNSYLFNLNEQSVLDARQFGNKLRFINHSKTSANCYAMILLVDGDHRVGIFAKQDIKPGVELFYDYRYDSDYGPEWAQKD